VTEDKYRNTYGIEQIGDGVKLKFVTDHQYGTNVGSRLYMLDESGEKYKMFYLKNREFAMTFDVSKAECGMNGAMYFVEMDELGGKGRGNNNAGAKYGTGYCDAQCPHDIKFIDGIANSEEWKPNPNDKSNNMGAGKYGSCCAEMDIWEANSMANAYTPHTCGIEGQLRCEGVDCGDNDKGERYEGVCDKDGCDINPFRMGNEKFYGRGEEFQVNTLKPITVVTQFLTDDGTDDGDLSEMRRYYVQEGKVVHSPPSTILGPNNTDSITDKFCADKKRLFGDVNDYQEHGGSAGMGESLDRGHVMAISLWDDVAVNMLWLDSVYPLDKPASDPGVKRGDCPGGEQSTPTYVRQNFPDAWVSFQNAFVGPIDSFLDHPTPPPPTPAPCVPGCGAAPGTNQPECNKQPERVCKEWMNQQGKCSWNDCPVGPTPRPVEPSPPPTPQCRMEDAGLLDGQRCQGRPYSGWGGLTQGRKVTAEQCKSACLQDDTCLHAVYNPRSKKCSAFKTCKPGQQQQFETWRKSCDVVGPEPSPVPSPEPTPRPAPSPEEPNPACSALCSKVDLSAQGEACAYLNRFPRLCEMTYVKLASEITQCQAHDAKCLPNPWSKLTCPGFRDQCNGESLLDIHDGKREHGFLSRLRSSLLLQQSSGVTAKNYVEEHDLEL